MLLNSLMLGCSLFSSNGDREPRNYIEEVVTGLNSAGALALVSRDNAISNSNPAACVGWSIVHAGAPFMASLLIEVDAEREVEEIPAISWDATLCTPLFDGSITASVSEIAQQYILIGIKSVEDILTITETAFRSLDCRAFVAASASVDFLSEATPQILESLQGDWEVSTSPVTIDFSSCAGSEF